MPNSKAALCSSVVGEAPAAQTDGPFVVVQDLSL